MAPTFPLVIGPAERALLSDLIDRAAASPTDYATMQRIADAATRADAAPGLRAMNRALTVKLPTAYTVTLTYEEHKPGVLCRHASIGLRTRAGRGPTPEAVQMILDALGFRNKLGTLATWLETLEDGTIAPNCVEPLDGDMARLTQDAASGETP